MNALINAADRNRVTRNVVTATTIRVVVARVLGIGPGNLASVGINAADVTIHRRSNVTRNVVTATTIRLVVARVLGILDRPVGVKMGLVGAKTVIAGIMTRIADIMTIITGITIRNMLRTRDIARSSSAKSAELVANPARKPLSRERESYRVVDLEFTAHQSCIRLAVSLGRQSCSVRHER